MTLYQDTVELTGIGTPEAAPALTLAETIATTATGTPQTPTTIDTITIEATAIGTPEAAPQQTLSDLAESTATISTELPHTYIFANINAFKVESWSVSKNINDTLWRFTADMDKHTVPAYFKNLLVSMVGLDRDNPPNEIDHIIFLGFIPGANYVYATANDKANLSGYDHGWYLAVQSILSTQTVTDETTNPATTLKAMLGDSDSLKITGLDIQLGNIIDVANWSNIQKSFLWKFDTKKRKAIDEIIGYTDSIFSIKPEQSVAGNHYPAVYFVSDIDHATEGLNLPDIATFIDPDPYIINIGIDVNESDEVNRVIVYGTNRETGAWKSKTEESAAVTSLDAIPRELTIADYVPEPPPADEAALQTLVDAKALELYTLFYTNATTRIIKVTLKRRGDLQLWQQVGFVGYSGVPEYSSPSTNIMRIVEITYSKSNNEDQVQITCIPTKDLSNERARRMALGSDEISGQQDIINDVLQDIGENEIGEVTAITGSVATITLEKDSKSVEARILNP